MIITHLMKREYCGNSKELKNYGNDVENITQMYFKKWKHSLLQKCFYVFRVIPALP